MRTNGIVTNENTVAEYMTETQVYIEAMKQALIKKIMRSKNENSENNNTIDTLLEKCLSVN